MSHSLKCPTCGHRHLDGIGVGFCACEDCGLLWTTVPFDYLAPKYQKRFRDLRSRATKEESEK